MAGIGPPNAQPEDASSQPPSTRSTGVKLSMCFPEIEITAEDDTKYSFARCNNHGSMRLFYRMKTKDLPTGYQTQRNLNIIKEHAKRTVRIEVERISENRPESSPSSNNPDRKLYGTGFAFPGELYNDKECPCEDCKESGRPELGYSVLYVLTARHVVFDEFEANNVNFSMFYDDKYKRNVKVFRGVGMATDDDVWSRAASHGEESVGANDNVGIGIMDGDDVVVGNDNRVAGFSTGGVVASSASGLFDNSTGGLVASSTGGLVASSTGGLVASSTGGLVTSSAGGLVVCSTGCLIRGAHNVFDSGVAGGLFCTGGAGGYVDNTSGGTGADRLVGSSSGGFVASGGAGGIVSSAGGLNDRGGAVTLVSSTSGSVFGSGGAGVLPSSTGGGLFGSGGANGGLFGSGGTNGGLFGSGDTDALASSTGGGLFDSGGAGGGLFGSGSAGGVAGNVNMISGLMDLILRTSQLQRSSDADNADDHVATEVLKFIDSLSDDGAIRGGGVAGSGVDGGGGSGGIDEHKCAQDGVGDGACCDEEAFAGDDGNSGFVKLGDGDDNGGVDIDADAHTCNRVDDTVPSSLYRRLDASIDSIEERGVVIRDKMAELRNCIDQSLHLSSCSKKQESYKGVSVEKLESDNGSPNASDSVENQESDEDASNAGDSLGKKESDERTSNTLGTSYLWKTLLQFIDCLSYSRPEEALSLAFKRFNELKNNAENDDEGSKEIMLNIVRFITDSIDHGFDKVKNTGLDELVKAISDQCIKLQALAKYFLNDGRLYSNIKMLCLVVQETHEQNSRFLATVISSILAGDLQFFIALCHHFCERRHNIDDVFTEIQNEDGSDDNNATETWHATSKRSQGFINDTRRKIFLETIGRLFDALLNVLKNDAFLFLNYLMPLFIDKGQTTSSSLIVAFENFWDFFAKDGHSLGDLSSVFAHLTSVLSHVLDEFYQKCGIYENDRNFLAALHVQNVDQVSKKYRIDDVALDGNVISYKTDRVLVQCITHDSRIMDVFKNMDFQPPVPSFPFIVSHPHGYLKHVGFGEISKVPVRNSQCLYVVELGPQSKFRLSEQSKTLKPTMNTNMERFLKQINFASTELTENEEHPLKCKLTLGFPITAIENYRVTDFSNCWVKFPDETVCYSDEETCQFFGLPENLEFNGYHTPEDVLNSLKFEEPDCYTHNFPTCKGSSGALVYQTKFVTDMWHTHCASFVQDNKKVGLTSLLPHSWRKKPKTVKNIEEFIQVVTKNKTKLWVKQFLGITPNVFAGPAPLAYHSAPPFIT